MNVVLLTVIGILILLVGVATLGVTILALQSSRRVEEMGEDRLELLRDQQERLELLREERRMLTEELERERQERRDAEQKARRLQQEDPEPGVGDRLPALRASDQAEHPGPKGSWWRSLLSR